MRKIIIGIIMAVIMLTAADAAQLEVSAQHSSDTIIVAGGNSPTSGAPKPWCNCDDWNGFH